MLLLDNQFNNKLIAVDGSVETNESNYTRKIRQHHRFQSDSMNDPVSYLRKYREMNRLDKLSAWKVKDVISTKNETSGGK